MATLSTIQLRGIMTREAALQEKYSKIYFDKAMRYILKAPRPGRGPNQRQRRKRQRQLGYK